MAQNYGKKSSSVRIILFTLAGNFRTYHDRAELFGLVPESMEFLLGGARVRVLRAVSV